MHEPLLEDLADDLLGNTLPRPRVPLSALLSFLLRTSQFSHALLVSLARVGFPPPYRHTKAARTGLLFFDEPSANLTDKGLHKCFMGWIVRHIRLGWL